VTVTTPLQGEFVFQRLEFSMINLFTKFEVCVHSTTKIRKATQNVEIGVVWGLEVTYGHWQCYHSIARM